jgi:hypothetical protein
MKAKTSVAAFGFLMMSVVHALLFAKGRTVKITIKGACLATPLEITDPEIEQFEIWAGPGVFVNAVEEREGFIINWSKGIVAERQRGLQHYEVAFFAGCRIEEFGCRSSEPSLASVVFYDLTLRRHRGSFTCLASSTAACGMGTGSRGTGLTRRVHGRTS